MRLGFYINSAIRLRENPNENEPDPAIISSVGEMAGAEVILFGWVPSSGFLSERDVKLIREVVKCDLMIVTSAAEMNVDAVVRLRPNGVILVASNWDGIKPAMSVQTEYEGEDLQGVLESYNSAGMPVSIFIEPELSSVKSAARLHAGGAVLNCSKYSNARTDDEAEAALNDLDNASMAAQKFGLVTGFAHGINYRNAAPIAGLNNGEEIYIGRAIVNRALIMGLDRAITDMTGIISRNQVRIR